MKNLILILMFTAGCAKQVDTTAKENNTNEEGKILFYTDIFASVNCKIDSVSIFLNGQYVGNIIGSYFPLTSIPEYGDKNTLSKTIPTGTYILKGLINGCSKNKWGRTIIVNKTTTNKTKLEYSTSQS